MSALPHQPQFVWERQSWCVTPCSAGRDRGGTDYAASSAQPDAVSRAGPGSGPVTIKPAAVSRGPANWSLKHRPSTIRAPPMAEEISHRPAATARITARSRLLRGAAVVVFIVVLLPVRSCCVRMDAPVRLPVTSLALTHLSLRTPEVSTHG